MVKNFIPSCDLCGEEVPLDRCAKRRVRSNGIELLMVALENTDPDLQFTENDDGTVDLETCFDCYSRIAFEHSHAVN